MSKKGDDEPEIKPYKNGPAQDLECWRQIQKKIDSTFKGIEDAKCEKHAQRLQDKNTYFNNTKKPEVNSKDISDDKMRTIQKFSGAITEEKEGTYCIYCTSRITPCPHQLKRENLKEKYDYPITSSSTYGWFAPYDNLMENFNRNSTTKEFYDQNHLS